MGRGIVNLEYTNKSKGGYCKNSFHRAGGQNLCGLGAGDCGQDWECEGPLVTFEKTICFDIFDLIAPTILILLPRCVV